MSKIDKKLQKECRERAIKYVSKRTGQTQKYLRKIMTEKSKDVFKTGLQNAVKNWTVEFYHQEMQKRYLK